MRDSKKPSRKPAKSSVALTVSSLSIIRSLHLARLGTSVTSNSRPWTNVHVEPSPVAPPGFYNRGEVRYGSIGGLEG